MDAHTKAVLDATVENCFRTIRSEPEYLLECDGGPEGMTADIVVARMFGYDGQMDREVRLRRAEPVVRLPIAYPGPTLAFEELAHATMSTAEYVLQSNYATVYIDACLASDLPFDPITFRCKVLCLRYKRR
jgi:hypothetical protein